MAHLKNQTLGALFGQVVKHGCCWQRSFKDDSDKLGSTHGTVADCCGAKYYNFLYFLHCTNFNHRRMHQMQLVRMRQTLATYLVNNLTIVEFGSFIHLEISGGNLGTKSSVHTRPDYTTLNGNLLFNEKTFLLIEWPSLPHFTLCVNAPIGQWLWLSWQQRFMVRIQSSANFY